MKIESINKEVQEKVMQLLNEAPAEKKAEAIMQSIEMIQEAAHEDLVNQVVAEAERASHDADFKKQLGLRNLSQEEKKFYEGFKDIKQSITDNQIDIIPTEIIDRTLDDVKKASPILNLVNMAPANVKKWIVASHTGAAVWGALTDSVKGELSTEISALNIDLNMLTAYLVIPKAIRELSLEFVDRYFMAILSEAMQDGLVKGYLDGDGKTGPIGIFRQIGTSNSDGTNKAKTVVTNITKFSPKGLSDVRKTLTNNGKRVVDKLYLICNPSDEAEYVDPCMYGEALTGGYVNKSFIDIEKIVDANCPKGKAAFTIAGYYTMGTTGVRVNEYDQTKAMEKAAFSPKAITGGAVGSFLVAMQKGVARGIFSNEAGLGSAPIAAAAAQTKEPVRQGLVSMTGTFIDTIVICTLTGLSIVLTGAWQVDGLEGVQVTTYAFQNGLPLPKELSAFVLMLCLVFFAFTTILGWDYYSERCLEYLSGGRMKYVKVYRWIYILAVFIGPYMTVSAVWTIADIFNGLMALPNMIALFALSGVVVKETRHFFERHRNGEIED